MIEFKNEGVSMMGSVASVEKKASPEMAPACRKTDRMFPYG
jgi:hypothetical protein